MKAVKESDFKKWGCVECGCEYCYHDHLYGGMVQILICGECNSRFMVMADDMVVSNIGIGKKTYRGFAIPYEFQNTRDSFSFFLQKLFHSNEDVKNQIQNGIGFLKNGFVYPIVGPHHREGILKHKLVVPDLRPDSGIGEFCNPRGVGYDLACFVKSKEAGERVVSMINRLDQESGFHCFHAHLDYREKEPLWIQVKIDYTSEMRAKILDKMIRENHNIITEDIVRSSLEKEIDFETVFELETKNAFLNPISTSFLEKALVDYSNLSLEKKNMIFESSYSNPNFLDQFEVYGTYLEVMKKLEKRDVSSAKEALHHYMTLENDSYSTGMLDRVSLQQDYVSYFHENLVDSIENLLNQFSYSSLDRNTYFDFSISLVDKEMLLNQWKDISSLLLSHVSFEDMTKDLALEKGDAIKTDSPFISFSLFGLYVQVEKFLMEEDYSGALAAICHVSRQKDFLKIPDSYYPIYEKLKEIELSFSLEKPFIKTK